jgi:tetratricopeptide (TPR) repeat protein
MWLSIGVCVAWGLSAGPAGAGIYISADARRDEQRLGEYRLDRIRLERGTLQVVLNPNAPASPEKQAYATLAAALEAKERAGGLTEVERADLGGIYLRLGRDPLDAVRVLSAGGSSNFLVLCNLAVANHEVAVKYQDVNRMKEAELIERRALNAWPATWSDWSYERWYISRRAECLHLKLLESRFAEMRAEAGRPQLWQTPDPIFPAFKMVGPGGTYEAGRTSLTELDALPPDAPWLVRELMMTYPADPRIYWLFGELLNAGGRVEDALQVLDDLLNVYQLSNVQAVRSHRRVLSERANLLRDLRATNLFRRDDGAALPPVQIENLLWALAPPPAMSVPIAGPAALQASKWATAGALEQLAREERLGADIPPANIRVETPAPPADSRSSGLPDWRVFAVGFGAGALFMLIVGLQRNEWKRRKEAASARMKSAG